MQLKKDELGSMTIDELWSLHEEISAILSARVLDQKRKLEKRLAILHPGADGTEAPVELRPLGNRKPRRKYPKVLPRYRNPDTSETWSGRGKRPRWLLAAVASGRKVEDFRISE